MLVHRFTEPTPYSRAGLDLVRVFAASWEIECCAPPPVVGEDASWWLTFFRAGLDPFEPADDEADWMLVDRGGSGFAITRGDVAALWSDANGPPPAPGPVHLSGHLSGSVHGPVPDDLPPVGGVVQRVWVVSQDEELRDMGVQRTIVPVPGTTVLTEVSASPRGFRMTVPTWGERRRNEVGVLFELGVPVVRPDGAHPSRTP